MSTLYLHIGTPKTGTTTVQQFMTHNEEALKKQSAIYPALGKKEYLVNPERNGRWLSVKSESYNNKEVRKANFEYLGKLSKEYDTIVMSDEGLWNFGGYEDGFWEDILSDLSEYDIKLKVIVYLRRQDDYAYSHYAQQIQTSRRFKLTIDEYLKKIKSSKINYIDYDAYLAKVSAAIGKENIIVRPYEKEQFEGGNLIMDFLGCCNLKMTDDFITPDRSFNPSITDIIVEGKMYMNRVGLYTQLDIGISTWLFAIQDELKKEGKLKKRTGFTYNKRLSLLNKYAEGNANVARQYLGRQDGKLFLNEEISTADMPRKFLSIEIKDFYRRINKINENRSSYLFDPKDMKQILDEAYGLFVEERGLVARIKGRILRAKKRISK